MVIAIEITTVEIVAQIPITMARVVGFTVENTAGVIAVALISPTDIIIRGIEPMIQVVFSAVWFWVPCSILSGTPLEMLRRLCIEVRQQLVPARLSMMTKRRLAALPLL